MAMLLSLAGLVAVLLMSTQVCDGAVIQFTQEDYESRSQDALLQSLSSFQIDQTELMSALQTDEELPLDLKQCSCHGTTCGCCMHMKIPKIHLNSDVCINLSYLPKNFGVQIELTVNGKAVFKKEVSARNPPAICAGVPGLKTLAKLCIRLYNLDVSSKHFSGCIELQAKLAMVLVKKVKLGCFKIPPKDEETGSQDALLQSLSSFQIDQTELMSALQTDEELPLDRKHCSCHGTTCSCCMHMKISKIHLNKNVCIKLSYLPKNFGVQIELTVNGKAVFKKEVSARNPPAICAGVPGLRALARLCIRLYHLDVSSKHFSGCIELKAKLGWVVVKKVKLGCFKIPPKDEETGFQNEINVEDVTIENSALEMESSLLELIPSITLPEAGKCTCQKDSCQCCADIKVKKIGFSSKVCLKASFLPTELGIQAEITINGKSVFKQKISVKNPHPICVKVAKSGQLCIAFKDLHISGKQLSGCIELAIKLSSVTLKKFKLGCFKIPPSTVDTGNEITEMFAQAIVQSFIEKAVQQEGANIILDDTLDVWQTSCNQTKDSYSCCVGFSVFHSKYSACIKVTFLPKKLDIALVFNGKVLFHQTVTVNDPPPFCVPIPKMGKSNKICLKLANLKIEATSVSGCIEMMVKTKLFSKSFNLGCFTLPPKTEIQLVQEKPVDFPIEFYLE